MDIFDKTKLLDPKNFIEPLELQSKDAKHLIALLESMLTIRITEEHIAVLIEKNMIHCPCHLSIGQEAIPIGIATYLRKTDRVFGTHRAHALFLALGCSVFKLIAETLGKKDGCSKGFGGSMHLINQDNGFFGCIPIVAGTIPIAAGAALAAKFDGNQDIALSFFGDGASEEGVFHETLNLAAIQKLPIFFVCENNLYASHLDIKLRQPNQFISRFAKAHCIQHEIVDGNDVLAVENSAKNLVDYVRSESKPAFLEAITYRFRGHVGPDENIDVGLRRSAKELAAWKQRCPIKRLSEGLTKAKILTPDAYQTLVKKIENKVKEKEENALKAEYPSKEALLKNVYAEQNK